ncbi:hypothetical protein RND71_022978 [Anisodus tanguticus]|uniref:Uncharacterized protein n=1 Tax=Anisodus tanguticus TaxID=243964 RepID=A0AAE1V5N1_9SOLA|nr:hypothetical protein RND71_022978 [Anisodus tanguticus]
MRKNSIKEPMRKKKVVGVGKTCVAVDRGTTRKKANPHYLMKMKFVKNEEHGSLSKKQKEELIEVERKEILMSQKVLKGRVFNSDIANQPDRKSMATVPDLFLLENLASFTLVHFPALMLEHMIKIKSVKDGKYGTSMISNMIEAQERATAEVTKLIILLAQRDSKIVVLKAEIQQKSQLQEGPGTSKAMKNENAQL